ASRAPRRTGCPGRTRTPGGWPRRWRAGSDAPRGRAPRARCGRRAARSTRSAIPPLPGRPSPRKAGEAGEAEMALTRFPILPMIGFFAVQGGWLRPSSFFVFPDRNARTGKPCMPRDKVILAYSGGLDTSVMVPWLQEKYNLDVVAFTVDLGQ